MCLLNVFVQEWPSLQELVQDIFLGYYFERTLELSNWNARPLLPSQLRFAALDALILIIVETALRSRRLRPAITLGTEILSTKNKK